MSPTFLHVVYAGRGDALIVEDQPNLYLVDGGPPDQAPGRFARRLIPEIYWDAVFAAAAGMGKATNPLELDGVVISHAHLDHFGGIVQIFRRGLSTNPGGVTISLKFDRPLVSQSLRNNADPDFEQLNTFLGEYKFGPAPNQQPGDALFGSFALSAYQLFERPVPVLPAKEWTVDTSGANRASVLMAHRATAMALTGDSAGFLIVPFLEAQLRGRELSIFKIPHHGSLRNSQRGQVLTTVPANPRRQYGLLCIGSAEQDWDAIEMPAELREAGPVDAARNVLIKACERRGVPFEPLLEALRTAHEQTVANIAAGIRPPWAPIPQPGLARRLWKEVYEQLLTDQWLARPSAGSDKRLRTEAGKNRASWVTRLTPTVLKDTYLGLLAAKQLQAFFSAFNARNYVASADGTYAHPSAETLAAIATVGANRMLTPRVLVTDGTSVDFSRLQSLEPNWSQGVELRYLARGERMKLDASQVDPIGSFDANGVTQPLTPAVTLNLVLEQLRHNNNVLIPARVLSVQAYALKVQGQGQQLYFNLDAASTVSLGPNAQPFLVDQAWMLGPLQPRATMFPNAFDDIRLRDPNVPGAAICISLVPQAGGHVLTFQRVPGNRQFVCNDPTSHFLTTDPNAASIVAFEFADAAEPVAGDEAAGEEPVKLIDFCKAVGVPTDRPLSCEQLLPQLVGPDAAATLSDQILSQVIERVLAWDVDFDSTVAYREDEYGPLVSAAEIKIEPGAQRGFDIAEQAETIAAATFSLSRDEAADEVGITGSLLTSAGTTVADSGAEIDPPRTRPLDQYLFEIGVAPSDWQELTGGTLLSAMVGAAPLAAQLLLAAPSPLVEAGIGEWLLDHEASKVATQLTTTGDYVEIRSALLVLASPGAIRQEVEGLAIVYSGVSLAIEDARLPREQVRVEVTAVAGTTPLTGVANLSGEEHLLELSLPAGSGLDELIELLPQAGSGVAAMEVPLVAQPLSGLGLRSPTIEIGQPSIGAKPYELAAAGGTIDLPGWEKALPRGWPGTGPGAARVRVLNPLDADYRLLELELDFVTPIGSAEVASTLRAQPRPTSPPSWSYAVSASLDPATQPRTAREALEAIGLAEAAATLTNQLPALVPALPRLAVARLALDLPPEAIPVGKRLEASLVGSDAWELVPGIVALRPGEVTLTWQEGEWAGVVEGEAAIGAAGVVAVSAQLPTAALPGAVSFESDSEELTVASLAHLCGSNFAGVPIVEAIADDEVESVELMLPPGDGAALAGFGFAAAIEPPAIGVFDLAWASIEAARAFAGNEGSAANSFWVEGQWGEDLIVSLFYDDAVDAKLLTGQLRPIAPVKLGSVLGDLLGDAAKATLLAAVGETAIAAGTSAQRSEGFELTSCAISLAADASLPVAAASAEQLGARWVAAHEDEKTKQEVPEVYVLDGLLKRAECKYEAALEVRFRGDDEAKTVAGTIRRLAAEEEEDEEEKEAKKFTVATLLELLDLERPQVLTPTEAPEFFELEPSSVEATFSVEPFRLEALTIIVKTEKTLSLLAAPQPIELHTLTLRVDYVREPEQGEPNIRGVILGDLPLTPRAVTLAYTEPEGEQAAFRAEVVLKEEDAPDYRRLIGTEPYDPGYGLPEGLEIPVAIPMTTLTVTARPDEYVDLRGHDEGTTWEAQVERLELNVGALGGSVKVTPGATAEAPHEFALSLFGRLDYHGFVGADAVFNWGPESRSLLSASASGEVGEIEVPAIAEDLGLRWREQVPTETPEFAFAAAWTYADLTDPTAPSFGLYGDGALGPVKGTAALLSRVVPSGLHADFLFGAEAEGAFPLQPLWQQLGEIVDGYLDLASGNLAVLGSEESGAEVEEDLAGLLEIAADQSPEYTPPFADLPPLAEALPEGTRLGAGLSVLASVDAEAEGSLNRALTEIAKPEPLPLLLAWGTVDPQGPERSRFEVDLAGLVAFDGAISVDAVAGYAPSEAEALLAPQATAHVEVDSSSYDFPGGLTIEAEAATFASDDGEGPTIVAPFGAVGADLRNCALSGTYRYPPGKAIERELRIVGFVDLEVEEKRQDEEENDESGVTRGITCEGAIEFAAGTAAVLVFALPGSMQATDFYANAMTGGAWPAGYRSFGLTLPRFHAAREAVTIEGSEYPAGYHALGTTRFLRHQLEIDVAIEKEGLRVGGASATAIDFTYLLLAEPDVGLFTGKSSSEPPPEPPSFQVGGAAEIFQGDFGRLDFNFDPALKGWTGLATYDEELVGVPVPEVLFSYTAEGGLRLVDWPLRPSLDEEELDWEEELEEASEGGECGKLEDLGLDEGENEDKTTETSFDLSMEQLGELEGDTLSVVLSGQYTVTVKSSEGERSTTMAFPDTPGTIAPASSFQLDQLEDWVKETIQGNHEELGKSLLEERDVEGEPGLESFLEEFGFEEAEAELIERLLCREDGPKKVRTRAEHIVEETEEKATTKRKEAEDELEEVETSTTISVLFTFLFTFFAWIAIVFQWIVFLGGPSFFGGLIGRIWPWLPPGRREEWEELVTKSQEAEAEGERVRDWVATTVLAMRGFPDVAFFDRTTVEVSWDADNLPSHEGMDYEEFLGFSFEVEVATDPGFESVAGRVAVPFPVTAAQLANPIWGEVNSAFGRVRAVYEGIPGSWIAGQAFHKVQLPAPEPVTQALDPAAGELTVTATAIPYAASYAFELLDTLSGSVVATRDVAAPPPSPATIPAVFSSDDLPSSGGRRLLLGRARAIGDEIAHEDSPFASAPQSEAVTTLPPPELNPPKLGPEGIGVTWSAVAGAAGYAVRVLDSQGRELSPQPDAAVAELGCVLSGEGLSDGAQLQVEARAFAAGAIGSWSAPAPFTVQALSPPTDLQAFYFWPENRIRLSWKGPVSSYQVEVVDAGGQRLSPKVEFREGPAATLTGPGIGPERDYRIRVRRTPSGRPAIWGSWLLLASEALAPPAEPRLEYRHRAFWASWRPIPGAGGYPIELEGPGGSDAVEVPESPAVFPVGGGLEPHLGDDFHAKIRAVVGANVTDYAIVEGPVPPLLKVAIDDWDEEVACQETARECLSLEPKLRAAQLWDTLVAGGYSSREASRAVVAVLPGTTPAKLEAISGALADRGRMIGLLTEESVPAAVVVALCQALYGPVPVQLLVLLKELKFSSAGLAAIFAATFPLSGAETAVLFAAAFTEPWCLGAVFATERQDCEDAVALLRRAYPPSLPLAASLAALNAAAYGEAELRQAFPVSAQEWDPAWTAVRGDATGISLAKALQAATVSRNDAAGYVISCWPRLSKAEVKEAIERAYGP